MRRAISTQPTTVPGVQSPTMLAFRTPEAAEALGISPSQLEALGRKHLIPRVELGGCIVWPVDAIRRFLTERGLAWVQAQTDQGESMCDTSREVSP